MLKLGKVLHAPGTSEGLGLSDVADPLADTLVRLD
jgi:hypothetical protein